MELKGDEKTREEVAKQINELLKSVSDDLKL